MANDTEDTTTTSQSPSLGHYQKYKDTIRAYQKRNQDKINAYQREYRKQKQIQKEMERQIALKYIQELIAKEGGLAPQYQLTKN